MRDSLPRLSAPRFCLSSKGRPTRATKSPQIVAQRNRRAPELKRQTAGRKVHRRAATDPRLPLKRPPGSEATVRRSRFGRPLVTNRDAPAVDNRHCSRLKQFLRETRSSRPKSAVGNAAALHKNLRAFISSTAALDVSIELIVTSRAPFQPW